MNDCANCLGTVYDNNTNGLCSDCVDSFRENVLLKWIGGN